MKIDTNVQEVTRIGVQTENSFSIKTTAKAFDILSSKLYTDPIAAIIRELSCNAYDAHVAARCKDVPFTVHLPNELEPFFSVKDTGTGLSEEDVMHLYTTYFDSTKTESNDFIGALGLGSKSPFSYVSSYEVLSVFDSIKTTYVIFMNEVGVPSIAKLAQHPTDEPNGLEVKLTVKPEDFDAFEYKASLIFRYFDSMPNIVGSNLIYDFDMPETVVSTSDFSVLKTSRHNKLIALQGNVGYKVDISKVTQGESNLTQTDIDHFSTIVAKLDHELILKFDIGDVDVTASREELHYDSQTVRQVIGKLRSFADYVINQLDSIDLTLDEWDVKRDIINVSLRFIDKNSRLSNIQKWLNAIIKCANTELKNGGILEIITNGTLTVNVCTNPSDLYKVFQYKKHPGYSYKREEIDLINPYSCSKDLVFFNDLKTGGIKKLKQYMVDRDINKVIFVVPTLSVIRKQYPDLTIDDVFVHYTNDNSILPNRVSKVSISKQTTLVTSYQTARYPVYDLNFGDKLGPDGFESITECVYFELTNNARLIALNELTTGKRRYTIERKDCNRDRAFIQYLKFLNDYSGLPFTVNITNAYGLTKRSYSAILKSDNHTNVYDGVNLFNQTVNSDVSLQNMLTIMFVFNNYSIGEACETLVKNRIKNPSSKLYKLYSMYDSLGNDVKLTLFDILKSPRTLYMFKEIVPDIIIQRANEIIDHMRQEYSLLPHLNVSTASLQHLQDYIRLVDNSK